MIQQLDHLTKGAKVQVFDLSREEADLLRNNNSFTVLAVSGNTYVLANEADPSIVITRSHAHINANLEQYSILRKLNPFGKRPVILHREPEPALVDGKRYLIAREQKGRAWDFVVGIYKEGKGSTQAGFHDPNKPAIASFYREGSVFVLMALDNYAIDFDGRSNILTRNDHLTIQPEHVKEANYHEDQHLHFVGSFNGRAVFVNYDDPHCQIVTYLKHDLPTSIVAGTEINPD